MMICDKTMEVSKQMDLLNPHICIIHKCSAERKEDSYFSNRLATALTFLGITFCHLVI